MKKKLFVLPCLVLGALIVSGPAWAAPDYSAMSTEELAAQRGTMQKVSPEQRNAFRNEWQKRSREMSQEERRQYSGKPEGALRDGSGGGPKAGRGSGMRDGAGQGNQDRYENRQQNRSSREYRYGNEQGMGRGGMGRSGQGMGRGRR